MATDTIKFKRGTKNKLDKLSYGEPAFISDEGELYIGTESGVEKLTRNKEVEELTSQLEHIENKFTVNIRDFGAKTIQEDAQFDSTNAIQSAIDYVYMRGGGEVEIPSDGTYLFSNIEVKENVCLFSKSTTLSYNSSSVINKLKRISDSTGIGIKTHVRSTLKNIFLDCSYADGVGIELLSLHSENVQVICSGSIGVTIGTSSRINNLYVSKCRDNAVVFKSGCSDAIVKGLRIFNNDKCGLVLSGYNWSNYIIDSTIEWNKWNNIELRSGCKNVYFNNVFLDGAGRESILFSGSYEIENIIFTNVTIRRSNVYKESNSHVKIDCDNRNLIFNACYFINEIGDTSQNDNNIYEVDYIINGKCTNINVISFVGCILNGGYNINIVDKSQFDNFNGLSYVSCITKDSGWRGTSTSGTKIVLPEITSTLIDNKAPSHSIYYDYELKKIVVKLWGKYYDAMGTELYID